MNEDHAIIKDYRNNVVTLFANSPSSAVSNWKKTIKKEIDLFKNGIYNGYDFEGIVDDQIIEQISDLIIALPSTATAPEISINDDGTLLLEWTKREQNTNLTMFSIILNGDELITSLMHAGTIKHYGVDMHSEYSIQSIIDILNDHFERRINTRRTQAG